MQAQLQWDGTRGWSLGGTQTFITPEELKG